MKFHLRNIAILLSASILFVMAGCENKIQYQIKLFETSAAGNKFSEIEMNSNSDRGHLVEILPDQKFQTIVGFGGAFTEASAHILNQVSKEKRQLILDAYFGTEGANYSLTRTHINSCDFSLGNYSYAPIEGDDSLQHFSIEEDLNDLIPMIKDAAKVSKDGFKIIASPWTAPPWMKDNHDWKGGKLLPEYYKTWSLYFEKYIKAYHDLGIPIWAVTAENEPLGNANNWESMIFSPEEMNLFVNEHLGPLLKRSFPDVKILGYDQNRDEELVNWANVMYGNELRENHYDGIAVHWYASTFDYFPDALQYVHRLAPEKLIIQTEACIDAEVPRWNDDQWYWSKKARDWGWTWASESTKHLHPEYVPVFRYAGDIIGCLNNHVHGWVDWNMVLDRKGGPNWAKNWCNAPVIVDVESDEVYFTPLYYVMCHFSKFIRPGAIRIGLNNNTAGTQICAVKNLDGSIVVVLFNPNDEEEQVLIDLESKKSSLIVPSKAIQTLVFNPITEKI